MRTDPRVLRSKAAILEACSDLIAEEGFGVTIEAVAARSGTARTTIYRHWPSREALLIDAFGTCVPLPVAAAPTGSLRDDLVAVLGGLAGRLGESGWCATLCSLLDASSRDPELARLRTQTLAERRRPLTDALERGIAAGELPATLDVQRAVAVLAGPIFYRAMIAREPVDAGFVAGLVDDALPALGTTRGG